jgi:hypothetical protein
VMSSPWNFADTASFAPPPISAGRGATPPVTPTTPVSSTCVVWASTVMFALRVVCPFRSSPAMAANGASVGALIVNPRSIPRLCSHFPHGRAGATTRTSRVVWDHELHIRAKIDRRGLV